MYRGTIYKKYVFQSSNFLWPKLSIFPKKGNFLPLNRFKVCKVFAQSCPRGWQRLKPKIYVCLTKMANALLKVWNNKWDCRGNIYLLYAFCGGYMRKKSSIIIIKNTRIHQKPPAVPTNQLTCSTNMVLSHYMHRLGGLQRRKVLKSVLHCIKEIFISPGNSSGALCAQAGKLMSKGRSWIDCSLFTSDSF